MAGRVVRLVRCQCRSAGQPAFYDRELPGTYNARRDSIEGFWRGQFGHDRVVGRRRVLRKCRVPEGRAVYWPSCHAQALRETAATSSHAVSNRRPYAEDIAFTRVSFGELGPGLEATDAWQHRGLFNSGCGFIGTCHPPIDDEGPTRGLRLLPAGPAYAGLLVGSVALEDLANRPPRSLSRPSSPWLRPETFSNA